MAAANYTDNANRGATVSLDSATDATVAWKVGQGYLTPAAGNAANYGLNATSVPAAQDATLAANRTPPAQPPTPHISNP